MTPIKVAMAHLRSFPGDRKPRKHGACAIKRGISNEKICINCGADRHGHIVMEASNRAKAGSEQMVQVFKDKIKEGSIIINDGIFSYQQLIKKVKAIDIVKNDYRDYDELLHLNTVNMIHSKLKTMIRYYRGVATKYLKRYISLFIFMMDFKGMDKQEKLMILIEKMKQSSISFRIKSMKTENILCL